jgi:hypothetical protein
LFRQAVQKENARMRQYGRIAVVVLIGLMLVGGQCLPAYAEGGFGFKGGMLLPDQKPFKDKFDSGPLFGGVLEFDSNMGPTIEASVEYFSSDGSGGDISIIPLILMVKYEFFPRYRTTPFVGVGIGTYFFDRDYKENNVSKSVTKTQYGTRVAAGIRFFEDRRFNLVLEADRNFVDFQSLNASSFQFSASLIFDFTPSVVAVP